MRIKQYVGLAIATVIKHHNTTTFRWQKMQSVNTIERYSRKIVSSPTQRMNSSFLICLSDHSQKSIRNNSNSVRGRQCQLLFVENETLLKVTINYVAYAVKVAVSQKWCNIDTLLLHTTSRKCHLWPIDSCSLRWPWITLKAYNRNSIQPLFAGAPINITSSVTRSL